MAMNTKLAKILDEEIYLVLGENLETVLGVSTSIEKAREIEVSLERKGFDFEEVWRLYPRKIGKASGIKWLRANVRTQNRYLRLLCAVKNYVLYCQTNDTDEKYIQHFSTWVKRFEDWVAPYQPKNPQPIQNSQLRSVEEELLKSGLFI